MKLVNRIVVRTPEFERALTSLGLPLAEGIVKAVVMRFRHGLVPTEYPFVTTSRGTSIYAVRTLAAPQSPSLVVYLEIDGDKMVLRDIMKLDDSTDYQ